MRISDWSSDVCSSDLFKPSRRSDGASFSTATTPSPRVCTDGSRTAQRKYGTNSKPATPAITKAARQSMISVIRAPANGPTATPRGAAKLSRSEEHTSELQSLMRISYAVFCLQKKTKYNKQT